MNAIFSLLSGVSIGEPRHHGRLSIFPLFSPPGPVSDFILLDEALGDRTVEITEVSGQGRVAVLRLLSTASLPILLVDGEELVGAKQNRILNITVLAPAGDETLLPVSCVEQGRWRYVSREFRTAKHTLFAKGRARKAARMASVPRPMSDALRRDPDAEPLASGVFRHGAYDADQSAVWSDVSEKLGSMRIESGSSAIHDGFMQFDDELAAFENTLPAIPGQCGAAFVRDGHLVGIELLATEKAFAPIYAKLLRSYAFDALEAAEDMPRAAPPAGPSRADVEAFIARVLGASLSSAPSAGLGEDVRLAGDRCAGHALVHDGAVIHLAVFDEALSV